jgi:hypothetical protein
LEEVVWVCGEARADFLFNGCQLELSTDNSGGESELLPFGEDMVVPGELSIQM